VAVLGGSPGGSGLASGVGAALHTAIRPLLLAASSPSGTRAGAVWAPASEHLSICARCAVIPVDTVTGAPGVTGDGKDTTPENARRRSQVNGVARSCVGS